MKELWTDIQWYEWKYEVSTLWNVASIHNWIRRLKKLSKNNKWYLSCSIKRKMYRVNRIVAQAFIPNPENKPQVNHKNWIRDDNRLDNLEWNTSAENTLHSYRELGRKWINCWKFWKMHNRSKPVMQYSKNWDFIKQWENARDIQRELSIHYVYISRCCLWKRKTTGWFWWKYI